MTLSGPQALAALDEALRDIRGEEDEILRKLWRGAERAAKKRETVGELLQQVARGRLDTDRETALAGAIVDAGVRARDTLRERSAATASAAARFKALDEAMAEQIAARAVAVAEIDKQQAALRTLSPRIAAAIARNPEYEAQRQAAEALKAVAAAARAKARQADIDRELKGRPYRADPLFMYLLEQGFGTAVYAEPRRWVARLDRWVATVVGFETASANYAMLNQLPQLLWVHADRQAQAASAAEEAVDDIQRGAIDSAGGAIKRKGLTAAQARIAAIDAEIMAIQDEREALTAAQTQAIEAMDLPFDRAVKAMAVALGGPDLQAMIVATRFRQPGRDDPLLAQLDDARMRVMEEEIDARDQLARLRTLAARRRELEDIAFEFKAQRFDDPRSSFGDDELVGARLGGFLTGAVSAQTYWAAWRRSQAWNAGTADWGGGVGLPRHGRQAAATPAADDASFTRPRAAAPVAAR